MAQRRMFSLQIVDTDAFLDMPQSSQLLYFHLSMRADDDGFVGNPKKIIRMCGAGEDDLKVLVAKRFILSFETGVIVIKHWKIHNYIQNDRYHETKYLDEKNGLVIKENGSYTECIQDVSTMDTEVRLGKVRLGKVSLAETSSAEIAQVIKEFESVDPKNKTYYGNTTQRKACAFLLEQHGLERVLEVIRALPKINSLQIYVAQVTTPDELMKNWVKLENAYKKKKAELSTKGRGLA